MVMPNAVGRYIAAKIARSVALTRSFHERSTAARKPDEGKEDGGQGDVALKAAHVTSFRN